MGCDITKTQNQENRLIELAAMRQLYADAKWWKAVQIAVSLIPAIIWAVILLIDSDLKVYATVSGFILTLAEIFFFDGRQNTLLKTAARIQESFDCATLCLDWNSVKVGSRPDQEDINEAATRYRKKTGDTHYRELTNWYRTSLDQLAPRRSGDPYFLRDRPSTGTAVSLRPHPGESH